MPVIFQSQQSTLVNKAGKKLYYPRVILTGNVSTNTIASEIAELSSLTTGDVKNVIDNLVSVVKRHLQASESVTLDGFGTFRYTLKTLDGGVENAEDVNANLAQLMVRFRPASTRKADGTVATRSLVSGAKCVRFDLMPKEEGSQTGGGQGGNEGGSGETPLG